MSTLHFLFLNIAKEESQGKIKLSPKNSLKE